VKSKKNISQRRKTKTFDVPPGFTKLEKHGRKGRRGRSGAKCRRGAGKHSKGDTVS
jgi:hypothetical protein